MAVEKARGCGYRQVGGIYLVGEGMAISCHRKVKLEVCPVCGGGIKPSRGWTWIIPKQLFGDCEDTGRDYECHSMGCKICFPPEGRHGLIWVGKQYYPTPEDFIKEAQAMGISRRIPHIPRGFKLGETWVYLAHRDAFGKDQPGIFYVFKPVRVEMIITESMSKDEKLMEEMKKKGITPVIVPDDDPDHNKKGKKKISIPKENIKPEKKELQLSLERWLKGGEENE